MPAWQRARIEHMFLASPPLSPSRWNHKTPLAGTGSVLTITFRAIPFIPLRMRWVAVIEDFVWNNHFCDTQKAGPFAFWSHCHNVAAESRGGVEGTLITDHVTYALPLGFLGDFANIINGRRQIESIFRYRQKKLPQLLERYNGS